MKLLATCGQSILVVATLLASAAAQAATCQPAVRVMSYNIRLDIASDGDNRWEMRRDFFVGQLRLMKPDILGLQEVVPGQRDDLVKALPSYTFLGVGRDDGANKGEYSSLGVDKAKYRVASTGTFWLSPTPAVPSKGWDAAFPRVATWAHLIRRSDGKRILALNTHMDHVGEVARLQGARQIAAFLEKARRPGEALVMTGDLNTEPGTPPIEALTAGALKDSATVSLRPAIGPKGSFNAFAALPTKSPLIDYILVSPDWTVTDHAVLGWHGENGRVASDHFPVVVDMVDKRQCAR